MPNEKSDPRDPRIEKIRQALRRERAIGRLAEKILALHHLSDLPKLKKYWIETLNHLGLPVNAISLQYPSSRQGCFAWSPWFDLREQPVRFSDFPWVKKAWKTGQPILVTRWNTRERDIPPEVKTILEVPIKGFGSLGINSTQPDAFDEEAIKTIRAIVHLIHLGVKRIKELEALQKSEQRFRIFAKQTSDGFQISEINLTRPARFRRLVFCNDQFVKMSGRSRKELMASPNVNQFIILHATKEEHAAINQRLHSGLPYGGVSSWKRPDGKENYHDWSEVPIGSGGKLYVVGIQRDITDKKRAEKTLRKAFDELEDRVRDRTAALDHANQLLQAEIAQRRSAMDELSLSRARLRRLARHLQKVREQERTQIAREIHDEMGQALTGLIMGIRWVENQLSDPGGSPTRRPVQKELRGLAHLADNTLQSVRRLATQLRPGVLDDLGLTAAIEWQAKEFEKRTGIACELSLMQEEIKLDLDRSTTIFRIFQETLTNVARHARASRIRVRLEKTPEAVLLNVQDNGRGITGREISGSKSLGLLGIRERVLLFGGMVQINGQPRKGTSISVRIPLAMERRIRDDGGRTKNPFTP